MKITKIVLALIFVSFFLSCQNDRIDCIDVDYDEFIVLEENNKYCFPDGNFLIIDRLENQFCPCDVTCIWEGEMLIHYTAELDGVEYEGIIGSSENTDNILGAVSYFLLVDEIEFIEPCSESVPSPSISRAIVRVSNE